MVTSSMLLSSLKDLQKAIGLNASFQEGINYGYCLGLKDGYNCNCRDLKSFKNFCRLLDVYINRSNTFKKFDVKKYILL